MSYNESLDSNSNYPVMSQSEWDNAPWNQEENPEREIEVTVSVTLSKTIKVKVSDYDIINSGKDEDGNYFEEVDYSNCDLKGAVESQYILPQEAHQYVADYAWEAGIKSCPEANMLIDWNVDDFEVIVEE